MGIKQSLRNDLLSHYFRGASTPRADTYYLGLLVSGTEVTTANWTNYARVAINASSGGTIFEAVSNPSGTRSRVRNTAELTFQASPTVSGGGPTVNGFALYAASTGGSPLIDGDLASGQTINDGAPVVIPAQALEFFLDESS